MNIWFRNANFVKCNAAKFLGQLGFVYLGYEGTDPSLWFGGLVWVQAKRDDYTYTILLRKQDDTLKLLCERILNPKPALFMDET